MSGRIIRVRLFRFSRECVIIPITGSMAEAYYGVPIEIEDKALTYLLPKLETVYYAFNTVKGKRVGQK